MRAGQSQLQTQSENRTRNESAVNLFKNIFPSNPELVFVRRFVSVSCSLDLIKNNAAIITSIHHPPKKAKIQKKQ